MKKTLGLVITVVGLLIIAGCFFITPDHALNGADSENGINASAALTFTGFIVFGTGVVLYISSLPYASKRS